MAFVQKDRWSLYLYKKIDGLCTRRQIAFIVGGSYDNGKKTSADSA